MWNRDTAQEEGARAPQTVARPAAAAPAPVEERRTVAWIGKSILFRGDLVGLEDVSIDGRVEGTIELRDHSLTVGPDGHIQADIVAKVVTVFGTVVGTITATDAVYIRETGSVEGNITSRRLAMADGANLKGQVIAGGSRAPADAAPRPQPQPQLKVAG
jgi:cytoskeletal protein CcmA (bactofilin family)